jgi:hypothetical protein
LGCDTPPQGQIDKKISIRNNVSNSALCLGQIHREEGMAQCISSRYAVCRVDYKHGFHL